MPKIIFWNIQRAGGKKLTETTDNLSDDLEGLGSQSKPDIIILCEGVGDLQQNLVDSNAIPTGYTIVDCDVTHGNYNGTTTLRYVVMRRNNVQCSCYLIDGPNFSRPALLICMGVNCYLALHAPSKSTTTDPQSSQMKIAYDTVVALQSRNPNPLPVANAPRMIFGDMNINIRDQMKINSFRGHLQHSNLQQFRIKDPGEGTHRNKDTQLYDTTLDWALCGTGFNPTIKVVDETEQINLKKRKRNDNKHQKPRKKRKIEDDFVEYGSGDDDDEEQGKKEFKTSFNNVKYPDHKPIQLKW